MTKQIIRQASEDLNVRPGASEQCLNISVAMTLRHNTPEPLDAPGILTRGQGVDQSEPIGECDPYATHTQRVPGCVDSEIVCPAVSPVYQPEARSGLALLFPALRFYLHALCRTPIPQALPDRITVAINEGPPPGESAASSDNQQKCQWRAHIPFICTTARSVATFAGRWEGQRAISAEFLVLSGVSSREAAPVSGPKPPCTQVARNLARWPLCGACWPP